MRKGYISGKITGLHPFKCEKNFENAVEQAKEWAEKENRVSGRFYYVKPYKIINPLDIRPLFGINKWLFFMIADLWELRKCDVIFVQDNWEDSKGAFIEVFFAKFVWKIKVVKL